MAGDRFQRGTNLRRGAGQYGAPASRAECSDRGAGRNRSRTARVEWNVEMGVA